MYVTGWNLGKFTINETLLFTQLQPLTTKTNPTISIKGINGRA